MVRSKPLRPGIGAECSAMIKFLHPSKRISEAMTNCPPTYRLVGLLAIKKETRKVNHRDQSCIVFRHDKFPNEELYCAARFCRVLKEGNEKDFFSLDDRAVAVVDETVPAVTQVEVPREELPPGHEHFRGTAEDIAIMKDLGFDVDDDNQPAPENIPTLQEREVPNELYGDQSWGWDGFCERRTNLFCNNNPSMKAVPEHLLHNMSYMMMFLVFFPKQLVSLVIEETNKNLAKQNKSEITYGEFLLFIGLQLFMSTLTGFSRNDFWSSAPIGLSQGAPYRLNEFMSKSRFDSIMECLGFTNESPPIYEDKYWEVRKMLSLWNQNMTDVFSPGWITCLDESMSIWFNKWTCPGWVYCPRKPHPFGNEYHDIACGISNILFRILLVEGKDKPKERPQGEFENLGSTTHLLLELCRSIFHTGRVVILDSGFCVLKALTKLREHGVFASAVIKKRRYWPKLVKGDVIEKHMIEKDIGDTDCVKGKLGDVKYNIFCMKDSKFIMKLMATYGTLTVPSDQTETYRNLRNGTRARFKYTECFANHYKYRHAVDDHNNLRHKVPSIEGSWHTHRWPTRVFSYIVAISEVNTFLALRFFSWTKTKTSSSKSPSLVQFRRKLALQLINNEFYKEELNERKSSEDKYQRKSKRQKILNHQLLTAPPHASFFSHARWTCQAKTMYPQYTCRTPGCKRRVRTSCQCNEGHWLCNRCFSRHIEASVTHNNSTD